MRRERKEKFSTQGHYTAREMGGYQGHHWWTSGGGPPPDTKRTNIHLQQLVPPNHNAFKLCFSSHGGLEHDVCTNDVQFMD